MRKKKLKSIWLILLYPVAILFLWEIFARLDDLIVYGAPFFKLYSPETMLVDHDEFGRKGKSNGQYEKWVLNSHGFRGPEIQVEKPRDTIRIVAFGASETFGLYESPGKEWPNQLRAALKELYPHIKIEVINAAFPGLGLESSKDYFKNRVLKFNPDIVLYYQDFVLYLNKPGFDKMISGEASRKNSKDESRAAELKENASLMSQARIFPKIKQVIKDKGPKRLVDWIIERRIQKRYNAIDKRHQIDIIESYQIDYYEKKLKDFVLFLREHNITVVLSEYYNKILAGPDSKNMGAIVTLYRYTPFISLKVVREGYPICNRVIEKVAEETNSYFVDQKMLLNDAETSFAIDGIHLTDVGAEHLMRNFLGSLEKVLENKFQLKPSEKGERLTPKNGNKLSEG